ncbi:MAG: Ppx/GppA phosphatase family protein [Thermoanaerobaculia bacterium]
MARAAGNLVSFERRSPVRDRRASRRGYRIAAIDVGTNSIHMIIAEQQKHGYRVIDKEKEMVQLGRDSLEGRPLSADAIARGVTTLSTMTAIARRWEVDEVVAVATSAIREAPNRRRFLGAVERAAGIKVRVISGEEEADYIYRAVRSAVEFHGGTALSVDIGGGSVELIVGTNAEVFFTQSVPLGALRMAQKLELEAAADAAAVKAARSYVRKTLKKAIDPIVSLGFDFTVGTSGTILTLATIAANGSGNGEPFASGLRWLSRSRLEELIEELAPLSAAERSSRFGIDAKRGQTILAGAIVLAEVMAVVKTEQIRACDVALREGIVESRLDQGSQRRGALNGSVRRTSVLALAERSDVDMVHASHVATLALRIFDQTAALHMLRMGERELLEYATLLHEVGMHVSYQSHHKHSYYLISHAGLRGFTADQVAVVASVARYHRKSPPKDDHPNFAQLSPGRRAVVRKLSAILRLAVALDRGRQGAVRDIAVACDETAVVFKIRKRGEAKLEYEAAIKKGKYFGALFEREVRFSVTSR